MDSGDGVPLKVIGALWMNFAVIRLHYEWPPFQQKFPSVTKSSLSSLHCYRLDQVIWGEEKWRKCCPRLSALQTIAVHLTVWLTAYRKCAPATRSTCNPVGNSGTRGGCRQQVNSFLAGCAVWVCRRSWLRCDASGFVGSRDLVCGDSRLCCLRLTAGWFGNVRLWRFAA